MGRPKKELTPVDKCAEEFSAYFAERFEAKRVLKTPFHFFEWVATVKDLKCERNDMLERFEAYCKRTRARQTWRNAAEWWMTGKIAKEA